MLIDFRQLIQNHQMEISGIIHVGAHTGEEIPTYTELNIKSAVFFEPLPDIFEQLKSNAAGYKNYFCINKALGSKKDVGKMHREYKNGGQSSSLLKPAKHLEYYPDITFPAVEMVEIETLDSFCFNREYNMICIDVQGYELEVLKGAFRTLNQIDFVYLEVNREDLYENCAHVEDIDRFLATYEFKRVETFWTDKNWGDALYIKIRKPNITSVHPQFQQPMPFQYPPDMTQIFEEYFYLHYNAQKDYTNRQYLPIFWTSYHVSNNYGCDQAAKNFLQLYISQLPRNKKYFTILQYDDGCLVDFKDLDIVVFTASGKTGEGTNVKRVHIPLTCYPHEPVLKNPHPKYSNEYWEYMYQEKHINCSLSARYETHPIRQAIYEIYKNDEFFHFSENMPLLAFVNLMQLSVFALAPRGYGATSFRIVEALQFGAVPVYISDEFILPWNKTGHLITIKSEEIPNLKNILLNISKEKLQELRYNGQNFYVNYCLYDNLKNRIIEYLKSEQ